MILTMNIRSSNKAVNIALRYGGFRINAFVFGWPLLLDAIVWEALFVLAMPSPYSWTRLTQRRFGQEEYSTNQF